MFRNKTASIDDTFVTADDWFRSGRRVHYDIPTKRIVDRKKDSTVAVFEKVERQVPIHSNTRWLTMLPGFPDGSYGFSKVDQQLPNTHPRLYVEYVGQGDSDKPKKYVYSTVERADLVEAQWRAHGIHRTVVVTFDYSSIVLMELLQRQCEGSLPCKIEHVLIVNGGLFADGHSHPWSTTPLLQTGFGKMGSRMAQSSNMVFDSMITPLYSKEYRVTMRKQELRETQAAIRRHKGTRFLSQGAGFVSEHKRQAERWNFQAIYENACHKQGITVHIVGSRGDQFEPKQIELARQRLKDYYPDVRVETIPGGHYSTAEQAPALAGFIRELLKKTARKQAPSWTSTSIDTPSWSSPASEKDSGRHKTILPSWVSPTRSVTEQH